MVCGKGCSMAEVTVRADGVGRGSTRSRVMAVMLKHGPISAADVGEQLGISAAGVRRHLDKLIEDDFAETCAPRVVAGEDASRGRPAKHYRLTPAGREQFGANYDELALDALKLVERLGGPEAVRLFARDRAEKMFASAEPSENTEPSEHTETSDRTEDTIQQVVAAFEAHGYQPSVRRTSAGVQICQHHCPVASVAAEHPELCEAEHEAIAHLVGTHVQPLALISDGHGICTTHIPLAAHHTAGNDTKEGAARHD